MRIFVCCNVRVCHRSDRLGGSSNLKLPKLIITRRSNVHGASSTDHHLRLAWTAGVGYFQLKCGSSFKLVTRGGRATSTCIMMHGSPAAPAVADMREGLITRKPAKKAPKGSHRDKTKRHASDVARPPRHPTDPVGGRRTPVPAPPTATPGQRKK